MCTGRPVTGQRSPIHTHTHTLVQFGQYEQRVFEPDAAFAAAFEGARDATDVRDVRDAVGAIEGRTTTGWVGAGTGIGADGTCGRYTVCGLV